MRARAIVSAIAFVVMIAGLGVGWWRELAESGVNIVCRPWVKPADYWGVYFDTLEKGKAELEAAGITIPFPQRDVHLIGETKSLESGCPSQ
jgi:small conductance mechanosensitive channel